MTSNSEVDSNSRVSRVLEKFSEKPRRPEELSREFSTMKGRKRIPRPTFYRIFSNLRVESLIFALSQHNKRDFGLVDRHGILLKGTFYFHLDEIHQERWNKIMQKFKEYDGHQNLNTISSILKREYSHYPLVSVNDLEILLQAINKMDADNLWSLRGDLLSFLEQQTKRIYHLIGTSDGALRKMSVAFFEKLLSKLHDGPGNVQDQAVEAYQIALYTSGQKWGKLTLLDVIDGGCQKYESLTLNIYTLIPELLRSYFSTYEDSSIILDLEWRVQALWDQGLELDFQNNVSGACLYQLSETIRNLLPELRTGLRTQ